MHLAWRARAPPFPDDARRRRRRRRIRWPVGCRGDGRRRPPCAGARSAASAGRPGDCVSRSRHWRARGQRAARPLWLLRADLPVSSTGRRRGQRAPAGRAERAVPGSIREPVRARVSGAASAAAPARCGAQVEGDVVARQPVDPEDGPLAASGSSRAVEDWTRGARRRHHRVPLAARARADREADGLALGAAGPRRAQPGAGRGARHTFCPRARGDVWSRPLGVCDCAPDSPAARDVRRAGAHGLSRAAAGKYAPAPSRA